VADYARVIIEGAGKPGPRFNMRAGDIVNMAVATGVEAGMLLVGRTTSTDGGALHT